MKAKYRCMLVPNEIFPIYNVIYSIINKIIIQLKLLLLGIFLKQQTSDRNIFLTDIIMSHFSSDFKKGENRNFFFTG